MLVSGLVIIGVAVLVLYVRSLTPPERLEFVRRALAAAQRALRAATQVPRGCEVFVLMLHHRTRRAVVTPAIIAINVLVFFAMAWDTGAISDPATLIAWGANFGPRTTNGEWWRLVTATFVHTGLIQLVASAAGLLWVGFVLERLVGPIAFAATYLAAGTLAAMADLTAHQVGVNAGSSGAIFGIYGLFIAAMLWTLRPRAPRTIPLAMVRLLAPGVAIFLLYELAAQGLSSQARFAGFVIGFGGGLLMAINVVEHTAYMRRVVTVALSALIVVVAWAMPLRGLTDVARDLDDVVATEGITARDYDAALARFHEGRGTIKQPIEVIGRIRPRLLELRIKLESIGKVPKEQQSVLANAIEYLKDRDESWRLRAEALRKGNMRMLRDADRVERQSLDTFRKIERRAPERD